MGGPILGPSWDIHHPTNPAGNQAAGGIVKTGPPPGSYPGEGPILVAIAQTLFGLPRNVRRNVFGPTITLTVPLPRSWA